MMKKQSFRILLAAMLSSALLCGSTVFAEETAEPEGTYYSELTGEPISESLKNQRPIAAMVDNESLAYDHYGVAESDVVYELMNSTKNGRITRLMVLVKDWASISQLGSIRSVRTSNIPLAAEWNAILCHDGGPFYVDDYFARDYAKEHFSGGFTRVDNGKSAEFTEYITATDLEAMFASKGYSVNYTESAPETEAHFQFVPYGTTQILSETYGSAQSGTKAVLPFPHTTSTLQYNEETGTYDYYAYGNLHRDAEDQEVLTFENVILQECSYTLLDSNGYLTYYSVDTGRAGYYLTEGEAIPITWTKSSETDLTRYYDMDGNELKINRGKTYISLIPDDSWSSLVIE